MGRAAAAIQKDAAARLSRGVDSVTVIRQKAGAFTGRPRPCGFRGGARDKTLHVAIPADPDYTGVFAPRAGARGLLLGASAGKETTNRGCLFKRSYDLSLKKPRRYRGCARRSGGRFRFLLG